MVSFTDHWIGYAAFAVFVAAYILVIVEESLDLRKSKPVMVAVNAGGAFSPYGDIIIRMVWKIGHRPTICLHGGGLHEFAAGRCRERSKGCG